MVKDPEADALVRLLEKVDTRMHGLAAQRVARGQKPRMSLRKWEGMLHELLRFAGTQKAKQFMAMTRG